METQVLAPIGRLPMSVTVENFVRAESHRRFGTVVMTQGAFGEFVHHRDPPPTDDQQQIVRANRDTLLSIAVFDLDGGPVTITLPDAGNRFMSMIAIDEDHYAFTVVYDAGSYTFSREEVGTRYVMIGVRLFVDLYNTHDIHMVHRLQDAISVSQRSRGRFEPPVWDRRSLKKVRDALIVLAKTLPDSRRMFGPADQVDPVRRLVGTAIGWGGNPEKDVMYINVTPSRNDGAAVYSLTVKDAPVLGFWSISVYNAKGHFPPNALIAYTVNSVTAQRTSDGSITVQFGGCENRTVNWLPITPGWNYLVRLYRPAPEILDGRWRFPKAQLLHHLVSVTHEKSA